MRLVALVALLACARNAVAAGRELHAALVPNCVSTSAGLAAALVDTAAIVDGVLAVDLCYGCVFNAWRMDRGRCTRPHICRLAESGPSC